MVILYTWSKNRYRRWLSLEFEILSLITSIKYSLLYYEEVHLYTTKESFALIEKYKLPITFYIVAEEKSNLWILNKINTYKKQTKPFIHIDADLVLLKDLDDDFKKAPLGFQSKDLFGEYKNKFYVDRIEVLSGLNISFKKSCDFACSFGVYVCNNLEANNVYCDTVLSFSRELKNKSLGTLLPYNIVLEQYVMSEVMVDMGILPAFIEEIYSEDLFLEKGVLHLMHNKTSVKYFNIMKSLNLSLI